MKSQLAVQNFKIVLDCKEIPYGPSQPWARWSVEAHASCGFWGNHTYVGAESL